MMAALGSNNNGWRSEKSKSKHIPCRCTVNATPQKHYHFAPKIRIFAAGLQHGNSTSHGDSIVLKCTAFYEFQRKMCSIDVLYWLNANSCRVHMSRFHAPHSPHSICIQHPCKQHNLLSALWISAVFAYALTRGDLAAFAPTDSITFTYIFCSVLYF